jgi:oxygen-dependent protoporphyrinogen oxidase
MAQIPILSKTPSVTVGLVNLFYSDPHLLQQEGFGYLIPNTDHMHSPAKTLGVIFDSCVIPDKIPGTKLTVMLGGHYWGEDQVNVDEDKLYDMAKRTVATQLGITVQPTVWAANLWKNAIPQYTVGHRKRMAQAHADLLAKFQGRVMVAGSSFNGVGVNDCVWGAHRAAHLVMGDVAATGLESYTRKPVYVPTPKLNLGPWSSGV